MRIEKSVTSITWIPVSGCAAGVSVTFWALGPEDGKNIEQPLRASEQASAPNVLM